MSNMECSRSEYLELCRKLAIYRYTGEKAWTNILEVSQRFTLEGETKHWFCCALYASCRESFTPTVGNALLLRNYVSLTKLWRCCNINIHDFLSKIKQWLDMADLPVELKKQIETLQHNFSLTCIVFERYTKIFPAVFSNSSIDFYKLCNFTWCLFLCAKVFYAIQWNLEKLTSLLLCCVDLIYKNVLYENHTDFINPNFKGVPKKLPAIVLPCIVKELSALINVAAKDAKTFIETEWHSILTHLLDSKKAFLNIFSTHNFEILNVTYERRILEIGAFDERMLPNNPIVSTYLNNVKNSLKPKICNELDNMFANLKLDDELHGKNINEFIRSTYFDLLDKIVLDGWERKAFINIKPTLENDELKKALFVCCVEIVLNSNNCDSMFPRILDSFKIDGFSLFKIIDLVVEVHGNILNQFNIRHLTYIEDCCLESHSWCNTSQIWTIIEKNNVNFPPWSKVGVKNVSNGSSNSNLQTPTNSKFSTTPCKEKSLWIFLRKFYKLSWFRLKQFCQDLNIQNERHINKMWNRFEYSVMNCTHILRDRHLDQIIMCAIYYYIKIDEVECNNFVDILSVKCTFRKVLIQNADDINSSHYNDLMFFYNNIYAPGMSKTIVKEILSPDLFMSPHPEDRQNVLDTHNNIVSPMENSENVGNIPAKTLTTLNDVSRSKRKLNCSDDCDRNKNPNFEDIPAHLPSSKRVMKDRQAGSSSTEVNN